MGDRYDDRKLSLDTLKNHIIEALKEQYARGLLNDTEFEDLLEKAENVQNRNQLARLAEELPDLRGQSTGRTPGSDRSGGRREDLRDEAAKGAHGHRGSTPASEDTIITVLGEGGRHGVWRPPSHLKVLTIMGDTDIDFTDAEITTKTVVIDVFALMADVDIIVPPGTSVEFSGVPLLSSFKNKASSSYDHEGPTIKISGFALMADVVIKESRR